MEKTTKELVLENEAYHRLKILLDIIVSENPGEKSFYTYFSAFLMNCEENGDWASLARIVLMAENHCGSPLKMIFWLSNLQHFMFPKDVETSTIE